MEGSEGNEGEEKQEGVESAQPSILHPSFVLAMPTPSPPPTPPPHIYTTTSFPVLYPSALQEGSKQ